MARPDCVSESFFGGKTRGDVIPQQCLFCAGQVEDGVDVVGRLVVLERVFPQARSVASWGFQDGWVRGCDVGCCSIVNGSHSFIKNRNVV